MGAPEQAIAGFVKSAGLKSIKDAQVVTDEKKGDFYVVKIEKPGRKAGEIVAEVVPDVALKFPWPKSMRFNRALDNKDAELRSDQGAEFRSQGRRVALGAAATVDRVPARRQGRAASPSPASRRAR